MKSNIPFKLYSGLGISIFLVLMVGYFSINTLNTQIEKTTHLIKVKKSKQLKATKDGIDVSFGIVSKIAVEKNHISGVSNQGDFVIVSNDLIPNDPEAIKHYKANNSANWGTFTTDDGEILE